MNEPEQNEEAAEAIKPRTGKTTRSGRIIGPIEDGSKPGEAQVSPGTT